MGGGRETECTEGDGGRFVTHAWVGVSKTFEAAHYEPYRESLKSVERASEFAQHGHTFTIEVEVYGQIGQVSGRVIHMETLSRIVDKTLLRFQSARLNDVMGTPTAEVLAVVVGSAVLVATRPLSLNAYGEENLSITEVAVRVREGEKGWASVQMVRG